MLLCGVGAAGRLEIYWECGNTHDVHVFKNRAQLFKIGFSNIILVFLL